LKRKSKRKERKEEGKEKKELFNTTKVNGGQNN
jgi:hypothetical protein